MLIHCYVSLSASDHEVYEYIGSVNTHKIATIALESLRQFGKHGSMNRIVEAMPLLDANNSRFYSLSYEHDREPAKFVSKHGEPITRHGKPVKTVV
jgi:hypothetical protein